MDPVGCLVIHSWKKTDCLFSFLLLLLAFVVFVYLLKLFFNYVYQPNHTNKTMHC